MSTRRANEAARVARPAPPVPPRKVPVERYPEVVRLCERHTQAEVAEQLGVSQNTIWRIVAAHQAGRPDLIRSPKRVLAHLWEGVEAL